MFTGTYTAIVTPFRKGEIDESTLEELVAWQIKEGINGLVPVGTTGESPTLNFKEHIRVIEVVVKAAAGKIEAPQSHGRDLSITLRQKSAEAYPPSHKATEGYPLSYSRPRGRGLERRRIKVLAGTGANSTTEAIELTEAAEAVGADGSLQVAPYYNKPTQEGLYRHFKAIAANTRLPIILYSIPGRCGIEISLETCRRLASDCPNIVGIKEAGGTPERMSQLRALIPKFTLISGDDSLTLPFMAVGAEGVISVASNVAPQEVVHMVKAYAQGKTGAAQKLHAQLYPLFRDLFIETNPIPVKAALAMMGKIQEEYRLPLCEMSKSNREKLRATLKDLKLI